MEIVLLSTMRLADEAYEGERVARYQAAPHKLALRTKTMTHQNFVTRHR